MGKAWRTVSEAARQKLGLSLEKNFNPTSNQRNEAMFKEAAAFAEHLKTIEKDLRAWEKAVEGSFGNMKTIMLSPLPRVFEDGPHGPVPAEDEHRPIGANVQVERLMYSAQEVKKRLEQEVIQPLKQWMVAFRTIEERMKELETLRLELDSRRRTVGGLQGKVERQRSNLGTTGQKGEFDLEKTVHLMQHKEEKMARTLDTFKEMEQTVYNSLFTLVKDTSVLRDYAAACILIMQDCFSTAYSAFEPSSLEYSATATTAGFEAQGATGTAVFNGKLPGGGGDKMLDPHPSISDDAGAGQPLDQTGMGGGNAYDSYQESMAMQAGGLHNPFAMSQASAGANWASAKRTSAY